MCCSLVGVEPVAQAILLGLAVGEVAHGGGDAQHAVAVVVVEVGDDDHVAHLHLGEARDSHGAEDAR